VPPNDSLRWPAAANHLSGQSSGRRDQLRGGVGAHGLTLHPEVVVRLSGPHNDFAIVDRVTKALRKARIPDGEIDEFCNQALASPESDLLHMWAVGNVSSQRRLTRRERLARVCRGGVRARRPANGS
jgi:hypothetical protein